MQGTCPSCGKHRKHLPPCFITCCSLYTRNKQPCNSAVKVFTSFWTDSQRLGRSKFINWERHYPLTQRTGSSRSLQFACIEQQHNDQFQKSTGENGEFKEGFLNGSKANTQEPVAPLSSGRGGSLPYEVVFVQVGEKILSFETGRFARQAGGAVVVRDGDTIVFCTTCTETKNIKTTDFLPFRVDYFERFSSLGKTIGAYYKREGRPSDLEILTARLIDRPLRPMVVEGYFYETQVLANVFSYDGIHLPDVLAICGCSASLALSPVPLKKTVAAVRVVIDREDNLLVNPENKMLSSAKLDLVVAGTVDGILMVEGSAEFVTEDVLMKAVDEAHHYIGKICEAIDALVKRCSKVKFSGNLIVPEDSMIERIHALAGSELDDALNVFSKKEREEALESVKTRVMDMMMKELEERKSTASENAMWPMEDEYFEAKLKMGWKKVLSSRLRQFILEKQIRPDGRGLDTIRPIDIIQGPLSRTHGSSLFTRGETQALVVATLGGEENAQRYDTLDGEITLRFYLQYFFPPFSVGEVGKLGPPGRREIGHGRLAERALAPIVPSREKFPYVIRIESNITESNGSSSMASVCGGCLALMEAGVPIISPVSGVAMGLIVEDSKVAILTDILGIEDALGDMDFKVAGTADGITAVQMDMKIEGIEKNILRKALLQAKEARIRILEVMLQTMPSPRRELPASVPRICAVQIPVKRIGDLIGPGGKHVRNIIEACGGEDAVSIFIGQDGVVSVSSSDDATLKRAVEMIENAVRKVEIGQEYIGRVIRILPFGMFVELFEGKEGWCHISEVGVERVENIDKILKVGDECRVRVIEIDEKRGVRVSRRLPLLGEETEKELEKQEQGVDDSHSTQGEQEAKSQGSMTNRIPRRESRGRNSTPRYSRHPNTNKNNNVGQGGTSSSKRYNFTGNSEKSTDSPKN